MDGPVIDYEEAFDTIKSSAFMETLRRQGTDESYRKMLENIYGIDSITTLITTRARKFQLRTVLDRVP